MELPQPEEILRNISPPEWLVEMHDHYAQTGSFRTEDVLRVLGNPRQGVEMASEDKAKAHLLMSQE